MQFVAKLSIHLEKNLQFNLNNCILQSVLRLIGESIQWLIILFQWGKQKNKWIQFNSIRLLSSLDFVHFSLLQYLLYYSKNPCLNFDIFQKLFTMHELRNDITVKKVKFSFSFHYTFFPFKRGNYFDVYGLTSWITGELEFDERRDIF